MSKVEWLRIDPETGEILDELVDQTGLEEAPPTSRRRPGAPRRASARAPHNGYPDKDGPRCQPKNRLKRSAFDELQRRAFDPPPGQTRAVVVGTNHAYWPIGGDCVSPVAIGFESEGGRALAIEGRCRRCPPCRSARAREWSRRARRELLAYPNSKFVTLTLNDAAMLFLEHRAMRAYERSPKVRSWRVRAGDMGALPKDRPAMVHVDAPAEEGDRIIPYPYDPPLAWHELSRDDRFKLVERQGYLQFRLYLWRVRKVLAATSKATFRYMLVCERSSSGKRGDNHLHWHLLLHEVRGVVPRELLKREWRYQRVTGGDARHPAFSAWRRLGFVKPRKVDSVEQAIHYTLKDLPAYVLKDGGIKIRSSRYYGEPFKGEILSAQRRGVLPAPPKPSSPLAASEEPARTIVGRIADLAWDFVDGDDIVAKKVRRLALAMYRAGADPCEVVTFNFFDRAGEVAAFEELRRDEPTEERDGRWLRSGAGVVPLAVSPGVAPAHARSDPADEERARSYFEELRRKPAGGRE